MCGIFCLLSLSPTQLEHDKTVYEHLKRRGPDSSQDLTVTGPNRCYQCLFSAHVLHMRGRLTSQPVQDRKGNVLLWNGEIFGGLKVMPEENDTVVVSERLSACNNASEILSILCSIWGPWGFIYYQQAGEYLWFGRDFFGRRSLLWKFDVETQALILTSVAAQTTRPDRSVWQEVPAVGVYRIDLKAATESGFATFEVYPWAYEGNDLLSSCIETVWESVPSSCTAVMNPLALFLTLSVAALNVSIPVSLNKTELHSNSHPSVKDLEQLLASNENTSEVNSLIDVLSEAVRRRVQCLPCNLQDNSLPTNDQTTVAILFSGGIDSMILAALADRHIPAHQPIDLLNVSFKQQEPKAQNKPAMKGNKHKKKPTGSGISSPFDVPDRITGKAGLKELQDLNPERRWNFVEINVTREELQKMRQERICHLVHPLDTVLDDSIGCAVWFAARGSGFITDDNQKLFTSSAKATIRLCTFQEQRLLSLLLIKHSTSQRRIFLTIFKKIKRWLKMFHNLEFINLYSHLSRFFMSAGHFDRNRSR